MDIHWKIETTSEANKEDGAFINVAFDHTFTGSQLEYVSTVNSPFLQETKNYFNLKLGAKICLVL